MVVLQDRVWNQLLWLVRMLVNIGNMKIDVGNEAIVVGGLMATWK